MKSPGQRGPGRSHPKGMTCGGSHTQHISQPPGVCVYAQSGLWVTNGTAAGTHELTGIKWADPNGLSPTDFAVLKNEVLFEGYDLSGERGLWVTNGTVAGTHEITGISGAFSGTAGPYNQPGGLNPNEPTVVNLSDPVVVQHSQLVQAIASFSPSGFARPQFPLGLKATPMVVKGRRRAHRPNRRARQAGNPCGMPAC
jgi:hypothetical protein